MKFPNSHVTMTSSNNYTPLLTLLEKVVITCNNSCYYKVWREDFAYSLWALVERFILKFEKQKKFHEFQKNHYKVCYCRHYKVRQIILSETQHIPEYIFSILSEKTAVIVIHLKINTINGVEVFKNPLDKIGKQIVSLERSYD